MKVLRVEKHIINKNHKMFEILDEYCFKSKNLYNYANYIIRQEFIKQNEYITGVDLQKQLKVNPLFKDMGSNSAQQTLRILDRNWKSFFVAIKDYRNNKEKYLGRPKLPGYLPKESRFVLILTNWQSQIKDGYLYFAFKPLKPFNNLIRTNVTDKHMQTRIVPKRLYYILEIVYQKEIAIVGIESDRILGIDLGVSRFATIQNNIGMKPFAINGGEIKAINNYYNKQMSKYKIIAKKLNNLNQTKRMTWLTNKRNNKIDHFLHRVSKYITEHCIAYNFDTVVIGYNKRWKQDIHIGSSTQHFAYIPYYRFVERLEYKLQDAGIRLIKTEESYTSKASFLDMDDLKNGNFNGKRIHRGLYRARDGTLINADVNGAGNIIRKVFPNAFANGIKGVDLHPKIINL